MTFRRNDYMSQDVHADQYRIAACPYHPGLEQLISLRTDDHRRLNTVPEHIGSLIRKDMYWEYGHGSNRRATLALLVYIRALG